MNRFRDFIFRPRRSDIRKILGDLEAETMELIWERPPGEAVTVRDVCEALRPRRGLAYTTVMTTMSRLARKGLLSAEKAGQSYLYRAVLTREEFINSLVGSLLDSLFLDLSEAALSYFVSAVDPADKEEVERLLREVERRRKGPQA